MSGVGVPASEATYSLAAQCGSEIIGLACVIYLGEAIIANELLGKTKGKAMGWGFVALGFGLAFGVVIQMFGYISAHLNPATCLALWVAGKISGTAFLALSGAEFAGALVGACLVWLHYLPHFKTVPEPLPPEGSELLLRSRDALPPEALSIASYNTAGRKLLSSPNIRVAIAPGLLHRCCSRLQQPGGPSKGGDVAFRWRGPGLPSTSAASHLFGALGRDCASRTV